MQFTLKRCLSLLLALVLALGAAGSLGWIVLRDYLEEKDVPLLPGQNYSSEIPGYLDEDK